MSFVEATTILSTGEGINYRNGQLEGLQSRNGNEISLFRAMCEAEYLSIIENNNTFIEYDWGMEKKWFATSYDHVKKWGKLFYPNEVYKTIKMIVLQESLKYMFYVKLLDNIGPAYAADVELLNKITRRIILL